MEKTVKTPDPYKIEESYTLNEVDFDIDKALIIKVLSGSHAYGMARPDSDIDIRGVFIEPLENKLTLNGGKKVVKSIEGQGDVVYHELQEFCRQASTMSVNAVQILFTPPEAMLEIDECGQALMQAREAFLNRRAKHSYAGFAFGEALLAVKNTATSHSELREKHGYDTKRAMNAVRICRMGVELMSTGTINLRRIDGDELKSIQAGKYEADQFAVIDKKTDVDGKTRDQIVGGVMFKEYGRLLEAAAASVLPEQPDVERINRMMLRLTQRKLGIKTNKKEQSR